ncbi:MAG: UDP-3-O-acyl-N-acetylglucosamine deacetylase [Pirellulales bacterium]
MHARRYQQTLAQPARISGYGYWSGRDVNVEFLPAEPDTGVVFVRRDLHPAARIPALVTSRIETPRRTTLRSPRGSVEMVEHILAALSGLQIDNCEVSVDAPEMPGCDGSSQPFVDVLLAAGIARQNAGRTQLIVREITRLGDEDSWIEARPAASGSLSIKYRLDYGRDNAIGRQTLALTVSPDTFQRELAPSRTFMLKAEADWLRAQGLGLRPTSQDLLVFDERGPIENELRYADECVRHKMLDLVGDFALAGCDVVGHFVAHRSGHRLNAELIRVLLSEGELVRGWRRTA